MIQLEAELALLRPNTSTNGSTHSNLTHGNHTRSNVIHGSHTHSNTTLGNSLTGVPPANSSKTIHAHTGDLPQKPSSHRQHEPADQRHESVEADHNQFRDLHTHKDDDSHRHPPASTGQQQQHVKHQQQEPDVAVKLQGTDSFVARDNTVRKEPSHKAHRISSEHSEEAERGDKTQLKEEQRMAHEHL